jgi:ABC-2 type transport system permease protein
MSTLVGTEVLKLRTTRSWWGMLIGLLVFTVLLTALTASLAGVSPGPGAPVTPGPDDPAVARSAYTGAFTNTGYIFTLVLGVLAISGEYRHQTITPTFLATPRRSRVVFAKTLAVLGFALLFGLAGLLASVATGAAVFAVRGYEVDVLADGTPRALLLALLGFAVWGVVGLGLGVLLRNQIVAILLGVGFTFILDPILGFVATAVEWGPDVARFLPSQASQALVEATDGGLRFEYLPWWGGALVLLGYGAAFAGIGAALTLRRDVA